MSTKEVDILVIGSGPSGQKAAIQAAKAGKKVCVIEQSEHLGGASLNSGTIPSKSLREAILDLTGFMGRSFYGKQQKTIREISITDLNYRLNQVLDGLRRQVTRQFEKNGIDVVTGKATLDNAHKVTVNDPQGRVICQIRSEVIILATGSKPRNPLNVPFDKDVILDSTRLLSIDRLPNTMLVLGGGIIGSEYASFFSALGTKVTVVDKKDRLCPLLDREMGMHLQNSLTEIGMTFVGNKTPTAIFRKDDRAHVTLDDGTTLEADALVYCLGRVANLDGLGTEDIGVIVNEQGHIPVNALFQTNISNIYAVGDVIGAPALSATGMEQGRLAARHACGKSTHRFPEIFPVGIYTIPEISCCGYTEEDLQEHGFHYEVGRAYYYEIARSHISGSGSGMFKILFHSETLEILGIHIIGQGATEVIHIGQVAMSFNAKIDYFVNHIFNYPTFAEGYRIAALNGINKLKKKK